MITLRQLIESDISQVQKLALKSWLFTYKKIYTKKSIEKQVSKYYAEKKFYDSFDKIRDGKEFFIVAVDNDKIIGYADLGIENNNWELLRIYVSPNILGKGIGSRLIKRIERFLKNRKVTKYTAYPHTRNPIAINFYKKSGFSRNPKKDRGNNSLCYERYL